MGLISENSAWKSGKLVDVIQNLDNVCISSSFLGRKRLRFLWFYPSIRPSRCKISFECAGSESFIEKKSEKYSGGV